MTGITEGLFGFHFV